MHFNRYSSLIIVIFTTYLLNGIHCTASISLNKYTFEKILRKFPVVLVKFDVAFPYGEKYEIFKKLAVDTSKSSDLLFGEVGVKDYGDKENEDLANRFNVKKDDFPALRLFVRGQKEPFEYPKEKEYNANNIKQFIQSNSNIYIGLPGCIEYLDKLASEFIANNNKDERQKLLKDAETKLETLEESEKNAGKIYIVLMNKILEQGDEFITKEMKRVENILKGKLTPTKKTELEERLNIILSFVVKKPTKDEL